MQKERIEGLDTFRGLAIFFMILYHFTYDLNYFGIISVDMNHTASFLLVRYTIMSVFLLSVGMSLALVHQHGIKWTSVKKRIVQLGLASMLISISTYFVFPNSWIYFGILHFIFIASLIALPLLKFPKFSLVLAILILVGSATKILNVHALFNLLQQPLCLPPYTEDLVPLFPWFAVVLLGAVMVHYGFHQKIFKHKLFDSHFIIHSILKKMGQHSLLIYLSHQAILFGAFELYFILVRG